MSTQGQTTQPESASPPIAEEILPPLPQIGSKADPKAVQFAHKLRGLAEQDLSDAQIAWLARYDRRVSTRQRLRVTNPDGSTLDYGSDSETRESTALASVIAPLTAHIQKFTDDALKFIKDERRQSFEIDKAGYEQVLDANKALLATLGGMSKYVETLHVHRENTAKNEVEAKEKILELMERASGASGWVGQVVEVFDSLGDIVEKFGGVGNIGAALKYAAQQAKARAAQNAPK